jgi:hypothetical protein
MAICLHHVDCLVIRSHTSHMFGIRQIPFLLRMAAITDGSVGLSAWNSAERLALRTRAQDEPHSASDQCRCGLALAGYGEAYNEEAFQYLLAVERERFERSNRPFVLVLIQHESGSTSTDRMEPALAAKVFASLASSLRETDVIGWYREERVVGAILTHLGVAPLADVSSQMAERITNTLRTHLPERVAHRLNVRLHQPLEQVES